MDIKQVETEKTLNAIIEGIHKVKGKEILQIDLTSIDHSECNYFIICEGTSNTHSSAIAESVEETVEKTVGLSVFHKEGYKNGIWILLDYGDILVHVFQKETRNFYNLEKLWADATIKTINDQDI
jgi:ribosome-associated protein